VLNRLFLPHVVGCYGSNKPFAANKHEGLRKADSSGGTTAKDGYLRALSLWATLSP
jgi:hypothetical protein